MNIFYLDHDPKNAAEYMCDKHVVKMLLEYGQLLCTAHHVLDRMDAPLNLYKRTHENHPCAKWVRESIENYFYVWSLLAHTCEEYTKRYHKTHKLERDGLLHTLMTPPNKIPLKDMTPVRLAMPDEYKCDDPVQSYRNYYRNEKRDICKWKATPIPYWFIEECKEN